MNDGTLPPLIFTGALALTILYAAIGWALVGARREGESRTLHNTTRLASTALLITLLPLPAAAAGTLIPGTAAALAALAYLTTATAFAILLRSRWTKVARKVAAWTAGPSDREPQADTETQ